MEHAIRGINVTAIGMKMLALGKDLNWLSEKMKIDSVELGNKIIMQSLSETEANAISINLGLPLKEIYGRGNAITVNDVLNALVRDYLDPKFDALEKKFDGVRHDEVKKEPATDSHPIIGTAAVSISATHCLLVTIKSATANAMCLYPDYKQLVIPAATDVSYKDGVVTFSISNSSATRKKGFKKIEIATNGDASFRSQNLNVSEVFGASGLSPVYKIGENKYKIICK